MFFKLVLVEGYGYQSLHSGSDRIKIRSQRAYDSINKNPEVMLCVARYRLVVAVKVKDIGYFWLI